MVDLDPWSIIGDQKGDDYVLALTAHIRLYETDAPALAQILKNSRLSVAAGQYEEHDAKAIKVQASYKSLMFQGSLAIFVSAVSGAAMMAAQLFARDNLVPEHLITALSVLGGAAAIYAGYCLYRLREEKMLETWMGERARAETARIGYFAYLGEKAEESRDRSVITLILEYFCRYQLGVQRSFYKIRGEKHLSSANRTVGLGALGAVIAGVANLGGVGTGFWTTLGTLGVVGASLTTFAATREQTNQDRRNAERYGRTREAPDGLAGKLTEVREAARKENGVAVKEFISAVNEQVSLDRRQWLKANEATAASLAKLEDALNKTSKQQPAKGAIS